MSKPRVDPTLRDHPEPDEIAIVQRPSGAKLALARAPWATCDRNDGG
jgi:hypothetical protein